MQTLDCNVGCCDTQVAVNVPGNPGATGTAGSSAFTTLTADLTLPAAAGPVVGATTVADSSWMAIGQVLFISDGVDWGHFRVLTIPSTTSVTLTWLNSTGDAAGTSVIGSGGKVTTGGTQGTSITVPLPIASGGTNAITAPLALVSLGAAASGANADITSLSALSTPLSVGQGGTGGSSIAASAKSLTTTYRLLGKFLNANFNSTGDQVITGLTTKYIIRRIIAVNASISLTTAAGGFYTGAAKTGTIIVAAAQVYSALTAASKFLDLTLAAGVTADVVTATSIYFALTTAQGAAATGDLYVFGEDLA